MQRNPLCAAGLLVAIALLLLSACKPVQPPPPAPSRTITATLQIDGSGVEVNGRPALSGQVINSGDGIWTGTGSSALVRFSDNTTVQVIDATDPVFFNWSGNRLVLRMDDAAVEANKGFLFDVIEAIGRLAHIFNESSFVVEEYRDRFFRLDLFSGRARVVRPPTGQIVSPGHYALITPDGHVQIGLTSERHRQDLRLRFGHWNFSRVQPLHVPNVIHSRLDQARVQIERAGLRVGQVRGPEARDSFVVGQNPPPGARVRPGDRVDLSLGRNEIEQRYGQMPDLRKRLYPEAREILGRFQLRVGQVRGPEARDSYVVGQNPPPGARVRPGDRVDLILKGREIATVSVPDVRRRLLRDALHRLADAKLNPGRIVGGRDVNRFYVTSQSPPPGKRVPLGSKVDLTVAPVIQ